MAKRQSKDLEKVVSNISQFTGLYARWRSSSFKDNDVFHEIIFTMSNLSEELDSFFKKYRQND